MGRPPLWSVYAQTGHISSSSASFRLPGLGAQKTAWIIGIPRALGCEYLGFPCRIVAGGSWPMGRWSGSSIWSVGKCIGGGWSGSRFLVRSQCRYWLGTILPGCIASIRSPFGDGSNYMVLWSRDWVCATMGDCSNALDNCGSLVPLFICMGVLMGTSCVWMSSCLSGYVGIQPRLLRYELWP